MSQFDDEEPFEIDVTDSIDLHAFAPSDTRAVTEAYLDEAVRKGFSVVRIIHGKGIGVQREMVRTVLAKSKLVESFKDAPEFSGSWGSTIVKLRPGCG
ncbi:MAG: Smr/MutS family protein [Acidobacteriota bacterium]